MSPLSFDMIPLRIEKSCLPFPPYGTRASVSEPPNPPSLLAPGSPPGHPFSFHPSLLVEPWRWV